MLVLACNACRRVFAAQRTRRRHPVPNDSPSLPLFVQRCWLSRLRVRFIRLPDCIGLLSTQPLIPMPQPSTFLFALLSSQYLQYQYYHGVTCISAEVNGFEMWSGRCTDAGLGKPDIMTYNGKTEKGSNAPKGQKVLFHHPAEEVYHFDLSSIIAVLRGNTLQEVHRGQST